MILRLLPCGSLHPRSRLEASHRVNILVRLGLLLGDSLLYHFQPKVRAAEYQTLCLPYQNRGVRSGIIGLFPVRLLYCFGRRFDLCGLRHQSRSRLTSRDAERVLLPPLCSLSFFRTRPTPRASSPAWPGPPLPSPRRPQDDRIQEK